MRFGPPLVMVALGGLTLALNAVALWRVIHPLTRGELPAAMTEARAPHRIRELEREKQALLKAIKEIELDFQMRKISEADYREMVERYRARALRVMGDLAAGDDYRALIERELKDRLAVRTAAGTGVAAAESKSGAPDSAVSSPLASSATSATFATSPTTPMTPTPAPAPASTSTLHPRLNPPLNSPPNFPLTCAACAAANDFDAQYCKRCGQILPSAPGPK
jgi:hypothetical protein